MGERIRVGNEELSKAQKTRGKASHRESEQDDKRTLEVNGLSP
jgi:hypothetical protein